MVTHSRPNRTNRASPFSADPRRRPVRPQRHMAHELARNAAQAGGSPSPGHPAPGRRLARSRPPCSRPAARQIPAAPPSTCSPTPTGGSPSTCSPAPDRRLAGARSRRGVLVHAQHVQGRQLISGHAVAAESSGK
ncbi:translation initiation factor IF-2-like isoform X1 [Sorghum bicolor]|uniref:translation initiation factor IF-2-like isoform X1 n=1 Tax=Sorghum bicolor TaxID=4558 RepID=UPI000B424B87|nr:translation initiation factor IF-2-like isoform X1 [Sorghum bicolor]|eukprot:XP_021315967.1 translation initiation factor IF-2-like isoform X1 [Sorghum bicolor]